MREELRQGFTSGKMRPLPYRKEQIARLVYMVQDHADEFRQALASDLGRDALDADLYVGHFRCVVITKLIHVHWLAWIFNRRFARFWRRMIVSRSGTNPRNPGST